MDKLVLIWEFSYIQFLVNDSMSRMNHTNNYLVDFFGEMIKNLKLLKVRLKVHLK